MEANRIIVTARSYGKTDNRANDLLNQHGFEVVKLPLEGHTLEEDLPVYLKEAVGVIAGLEPYTREMIESAKNLRVISRYGVGYDKVDCQAARERGILVTITPGANGDSVADLAVALMLSVARNIPLMNASLKAGAPERPSGLEMCGKTVGIIGAGRIGKGVAARCSGFGMKILLYDAFYQDEAFAGSIGAHFTDLDTILTEADFISLHTDLNEGTRNMFGAEQFRKMKNTAVIVNTARGGIIDEAALYEALCSGEIFGAGLDVTVTEPASQSPLAGLPNCILTPHAGAATREASSRVSYMAAQNTIEAIKTGKCCNTVKECLG